MAETREREGIDYSHLVGKRVRLIHCTDQFTNLERGAEGVVRHVDDRGTLHVSWDDGRSLGLIPGEDSWEVIA